MSKFISQLEGIVSPDWATLAVVALLCAIAAYVVQEYLAHPPMIIFVYPIMIFFALAGYYLFVATEQFNPKKVDQRLMWTILAAIAGTWRRCARGWLTGARRRRNRPGPRADTPAIRPSSILHCTQVRLGCTGRLSAIWEPSP